MLTARNPKVLPAGNVIQGKGLPAGNMQLFCLFRSNILVHAYNDNMLTRRHFLLSSLASLLLTTEAAARSGRALNFGLTPVILNDRQKFLRQWGEWMSDKLSHDIHFSQRSKYREIMDLLLTRQLDLAWVCGYPYVSEKANVRLLAIPLYYGQPRYHSLIITGTDNTEIKQFSDLENRIFAFSDPDSNSGYLYPKYRIQQQFNSTIDSFFTRSFFTWSHQNTIEAVAAGLAQGGAVDSYVWDQVKRLQPDLVAQTRILETSPSFGFPPLITHKNIDPELFDRLQDYFIQMNQTRTGQQILKSLGLDGFEKGSPEFYDSIQAMADIT